MIPKVVLRDEATRDRSTVCFETMWSTVACLRDVWTSYEFVKNFRVVSSSWYESNDSHASRNPKHKDPAFKLTRQWMSSELKPLFAFVVYGGLLPKYVHFPIKSIAKIYFCFRTCSAVRLIKVKLGYGHHSPLITSSAIAACKWYVA